LSGGGTVVTTRHAFAVDRFDSKGTFQTLPIPELTASALLVRVIVAGTNPVDWKIRDGLHRAPAFPFVLGADFAGVVASIGADVMDFAPGERVFGIARTSGAYADYTVVDLNRTEEPVVKTPPSLSDAHAAVLPIAGITALAGLNRLRLRAGETLLLIGATGGVGGFASQIAAARGVRVLGTARTGKEELARWLGIADVLHYDRSDPLLDVAARYPDGVDAVFDLVSGPDDIRRLTEVLRPGGRVVSGIYAADEAWFGERGYTASNISRTHSPESSAAGLAELIELIDSGALRIRLQAQRSLTEATAVLDEIKAGALTGNVALTVGTP
jgi:NADPH:quinone reductase-like Zn-dependent oxidoreductase